MPVRWLNRGPALIYPRAMLQSAFALLLFLSPAIAAEPDQLTGSERRDGWRLLFDGKTTEGWQEITGKPFPHNCWTIENGCLKALVRTDGFQDIRTLDQFGSFDLQFDWKLLKDGNSGVKYLIRKVDEWTNAAGRQARARGLEYQLADDHNADASDPRRVAASLYSIFAPVPRVPPLIGEFNHSRILVRGTHIEHWLNGVKAVEFETTAPEVRKLDPTSPSPISLQNHSSEVWFRNIKIRPL
jgi:3-keto-disaccharide hydrolase